MAQARFIVNGARIRHRGHDEFFYPAVSAGLFLFTHISVRLSDLPTMLFAQVGSTTSQKW